MTRPTTHERHAVRVWLPDRPGALGQVASRIGAVAGEIVGIEIIERDGGLAVDDLYIELPVGADVGLLVREVGEVDGVHVEDVRPLTLSSTDARSQSLEAAVDLVEATDGDELLRRLCRHAHLDTRSTWAVVVDEAERAVLVHEGEPPDTGWVAAFATGARAAGHDLDTTGRTGVGSRAADTVAVPLGPEDPPRSLVLGRAGRGFQRREMHSLSLLARVVNAMLSREPPGSVR